MVDKNIRMVGLFHFIFAIFLALVIYVTLRQSILLSKFSSIFPWFLTLRQKVYVPTEDNGIFIFVKYYFPDLLWAYALESYSYFFMGIKSFTFYYPLMICVVMELLQLTDFVSGTFDILDILVEFLGISLGFVFFLLREKIIEKARRL